MKKLAVLAFIIIFIGTFVGCQYTDGVTDEGTINQANNQSTTAIQSDVTLYTKMHLVSTENAGVFDIEASQSQSKEPFINTNAQQNMQIELLGAVFDIEYQESVYFGDDNIPVDVYKIVDGEDHECVLLNSATGDVVKYNYLPHTANLTTEQQYRAFVEQVLGEGATDEYDYHCTTHYYEISDLGVSSKTENGFIICGDNQRLGGYTLYYTKSVDGIALPDHITADFGDQSFMIEKVDLGYDSSYYQQTISDIDAINENIEEYIIQHLNDGITCTGINILSQRVICNSDEMQVLSYVTVKIAYENEKEYVEYEIVVQTITGWEMNSLEE